MDLHVRATWCKFSQIQKPVVFKHYVVSRVGPLALCNMQHFEFFVVNFAHKNYIKLKFHFKIVQSMLSSMPIKGLVLCFESFTFCMFSNKTSKTLTPLLS